jgi:hypothetical protein
MFCFFQGSYLYYLVKRHRRERINKEQISPCSSTSVIRPGQQHVVRILCHMGLLYRLPILTLVGRDTEVPLWPYWQTRVGDISRATKEQLPIHSFWVRI